MFTSKTGSILICIVLLLKTFSISINCALHAPLYVGNSENRKTYSRSRSSPDTVETSFTPIPMRPFDSIDAEKDLDDSDMFFPYSFSSFKVTDIMMMNEINLRQINQDHLKMVEELNKQMQPKKRFDYFKPADSSKFKSIEQVTNGFMKSATEFKERISPWSPALTASTLTTSSLAPSTAYSPLPIVEGKRVVKKEKDNSIEYYGGFPGWDISDDEVSEYEYVTDEYEISDFDEDSDNEAEDDEDVIVVNGMKVYKTVENPTILSKHYENDNFYGSYDSGSESDSEVQKEEVTAPDNEEDYDSDEEFLKSIATDMKNATIMNED